MRWTLLCRVVDNFGDIGENDLRVAYALPGKGERHDAIDAVKARLVAELAPEGAAGVEVVAWDTATALSSDVLVETFGCGWPERISAELRGGAARPVCVNVEHLSA